MNRTKERIWNAVLIILSAGLLLFLLRFQFLPVFLSYKHIPLTFAIKDGIAALKKFSKSLDKT